MLNSRIFLILILLFLTGGNLYAQKTILLPPRLKLELPDDSWKLTSHNASEALWLNDEKVIESGDGRVELRVSCFYRRIIPFGFMIVDHGIFLTSSIENGTMECDSLQDFQVCAVEGEKVIFFRAMLYTPDGYIIEILAEFNELSKEESRSIFENIVNQSQVMSLAEMDVEFGFPLDPSADNSEFIEERKRDLLEFYDEEWGFSWTMEGLNDAPLEEIVPELYDGFSFERLFSIWNQVLNEETELNDFLDALFLDKNSTDLQLYFDYVHGYYGYSRRFWDLEFSLLNSYFGANAISEKYFNENVYWADSYEVCGDSGQLVSVWRLYLDSTESSFILVSFHKNGEVLSSDRDWQVDWVGNTEYEILDVELASFWDAIIVGDDTDCSNEMTNLVGFTALNSDSIETVYVGSPNNINTSIVPLEAYQQKEDEVHYLVYAFNSLTRRANRPLYSEFVNVSDSLAYIFTSSMRLMEEFNELSKMKPEQVMKRIDPIFVESYRGNQGKSCRSIECDMQKRPVYYAVNSQLFDLPPEKRVYSTDVIHEDLNHDGRVDAYFFSISNGEVVHASIVYDVGNNVQAETSVEKYFEQFKNSEEGSLLIRISLDEKNLLPAFWPHFYYIK